MEYIGKNPNIGKIELSDDVTSDRSDVSASSKAVKTVNDKTVITEEKITQINQKIMEVDSTVTGIENNIETIINTAGGGATILSLTEDKVLTADDPRNMLVTATTPGLSIMLPDTTAIETDGVAFRFSVSGENSITIKTSAGKTIGEDSGKIKPNKMRIFVLVDRVSGTWMCAEYGDSSSEKSIALKSLNVFSTDSSSKYVLDVSAIDNNNISIIEVDGDNSTSYIKKKRNLYGYIINITEDNITVGERKQLLTISGSVKPEISANIFIEKMNNNIIFVLDTKITTSNNRFDIYYSLIETLPDGITVRKNRLYISNTIYKFKDINSIKKVNDKTIFIYGTNEEGYYSIVSVQINYEELTILLSDAVSLPKKNINSLFDFDTNNSKIAFVDTLKYISFVNVNSNNVVSTQKTNIKLGEYDDPVGCELRDGKYIINVSTSITHGPVEAHVLLCNNSGVSYDIPVLSDINNYFYYINIYRLTNDYGLLFLSSGKINTIINYAVIYYPDSGRGKLTLLNSLPSSANSVLSVSSIDSMKTYDRPIKIINEHTVGICYEKRIAEPYSSELYMGILRFSENYKSSFFDEIQLTPIGDKKSGNKYNLWNTQNGIITTFNQDNIAYFAPVNTSYQEQ